MTINTSSTTFLVLFLAIIILFVIDFTKKDSYQIQKCIDDSTGSPPYILSQDQSVLYYDPTVTIDKNQPFSTCNWVPEGYTSNPKRDCPLDSQYVLTPVIPMSSISVLKNLIDQAQQLIMNSSSNKSIIYFQSLSTIHCSIQYFSCYNYSEYSAMQEVLSDFKWNSFIVKFNKISCDVSTVGSYLLIEADLLSQDKFFHFVKKLEKQIHEKNIQIKIPRIENFHLTIAGVNYTYPSDCIINKLKKQLENQEFGSVRICCFIVDTGVNVTNYYAQDCNENDECVFGIM